MGEIDVDLARRLLRAQFPHWAHLPVTNVAEQGHDNRTFRLGTELKLRLPSAAHYAAQAEKEARWLHVLAPHLPVKVPEVVAVGTPDDGYPWPWSVQTWLDGTPARPEPIEDSVTLAQNVAAFLAALRAVESSGGPEAGAHSFHRGGALRIYDAELREAADALNGLVDRGAALAVWEEALASRWADPLAWVHGDVAAGNLLVRDGRLCGVIDFGCMATGDPACDLVPAWTLFEGDARQAFKAEAGLDDATWARARGWALWKAMITLAADQLDHTARRVIAAVLAQ